MSLYLETLRKTQTRFVDVKFQVLVTNLCCFFMVITNIFRSLEVWNDKMFKEIVLLVLAIPYHKGKDKGGVIYFLVNLMCYGKV